METFNLREKEGSITKTLQTKIKGCSLLSSFAKERKKERNKERNKEKRKKQRKKERKKERKKQRKKRRKRKETKKKYQKKLSVLYYIRLVCFLSKNTLN